MLTSIVVAAEWPIPHSHFYRGGRGVADPRIITFIVMALRVLVAGTFLYTLLCGGREEQEDIHA